jgi:hypothetical protein
MRKKERKINETMLGFSKDILPTADGCHPSITIGTQSNMILLKKKYDSFKSSSA